MSGRHVTSNHGLREERDRFYPNGEGGNVSQTDDSVKTENLKTPINGGLQTLSKLDEIALNGLLTGGFCYVKVTSTNCERPFLGLGTAVVTSPPRHDSPGQVSKAGVFHYENLGKIFVDELMSSANPLGLCQYISNSHKSTEHKPRKSVCNDIWFYRVF